MTVNSINTRAIEQSTSTTSAAGSVKSSEDMAAEFTSALQQATSSLFGSTTASRTPNTDAAFKSHFERKADQAEQSEAVETTTRKADKPVQRNRGRDDDKAAARNEKARTKTERKDDKVEAKNSEPATTKTADTEETAADTAGDKQPQPQAAAEVVPPPTVPVAPQSQTITVDADAAGDAQGTAQTATDKTPMQQAAAGQAQAGQNAAEAGDADGQANADGADFADLMAANTAENTGGEANKQNTTKADTVAEAQANDLALQLDDTGAQLNIQVQVSNSAEAKSQTAEFATTTADLPDAQDVAALPVAPVEGDTASNQTSAQTAGSAATAQPDASQTNAGQSGTAPQAGQPFNAILAAQAEATTGAQADTDTGTGQSQNNQPVTALTGTGATTAAQKAQASQAAQAARQPQLPQSKEVMDQVSVQIAKQSKDGNNTIKVQLKPVELGAIEIKMDVAKDGTVTTVVTADNKETLDLLKKDQSSLQKALADAGLKSDTGSMSFNLRENNQQQAQQQQNSGSNVGRRRARLEAAAAADAASARAAAAAQTRWGVGRSGVDIQV